MVPSASHGQPRPCRSVAHGREAQSAGEGVQGDSSGGGERQTGWRLRLREWNCMQYFPQRTGQVRWGVT